MDKPIKKEKKAWWQPAMEIFVQISGWIVFPLLIAIFAGQWLEERYGNQWYYIGAVAIAFVITNIGLIKTAMKEAQKIQKISDINKEKEK